MSKSGFPKIICTHTELLDYIEEIPDDNNYYISKNTIIKQYGNCKTDLQTYTYKEFEEKMNKRIGFKKIIIHISNERYTNGWN